MLRSLDLPRRAAGAAQRTLPLPRAWAVRAADLSALAALNAGLIVAMWVRHGGLDQLGTAAGTLTAMGQLAALLGTYAALIGIMLMSRAPFIDQVLGTDRLAWYHRWVGFLTVWLLVGHAVFTTAGYALGDGSGVVAELGTLLATYPFVLAAAVGLGLFVLVAVSSIRSARRRAAYETWFGLHLYVYLAVALAFAHQFVVGSDLAHDPVARLYWIGLYAVAAGLLLAFRVVAPLVLNARHRFVVANVVPEARGVASIYVGGRDLDRLAVRSGQFFLLRLLTRDGWYRAHPFSISAAPNGQYLRFTVKDLGDWSHRLQSVGVGTRVFLEGPYGVLTGARRNRRKVLLVAGGVGITPLRAMLESFAADPGELVLVYRAPNDRDIVFRHELDLLAASRGAVVHYLIGRRGEPGVPAEPLGAEALRRLVPDTAERDAYLCGPVEMMDAARRSLLALGVPGRRIHLERFTY
jgi:predicted ferric reductase